MLWNVTLVMLKTTKELIYSSIYSTPLFNILTQYLLYAMRDIIRKKKDSTPRVTFNRLKINNVNSHKPNLLSEMQMQ